MSNQDELLLQLGRIIQACQSYIEVSSLNVQAVGYTVLTKVRECARSRECQCTKTPLLGR